LVLTLLLTASPDQCTTDPMQFSTGKVSDQTLQDIAEDYDFANAIAIEIINFKELSVESIQALESGIDKVAEKWRVIIVFNI
jgi:hypothetical protein